MMNHNEDNTKVVAVSYSYDEDDDDDDDNNINIINMSIPMLGSNNSSTSTIQIEEEEEEEENNRLKKCCKVKNNKWNCSCYTLFLFIGLVGVVVAIIIFGALTNKSGSTKTSTNNNYRRQLHTGGGLLNDVSAATSTRTAAATTATTTASHPLLVSPSNHDKSGSDILSSHRTLLLDEKKHDDVDSPSDLKMERLITSWTIQQQQQVTSKEENQKKFFTNKSDVHVIQIGDEHYQKWYHRQSTINKSWSQCAGYNYKLLDWEKPMFEKGEDMGSHNCAYTTKVKMIRDYFLDHTRLGDWLIFIDLDAYYQYTDCTMLEQVLYKEEQQLLYNDDDDTNDVTDDVVTENIRRESLKEKNQYTIQESNSNTNSRTQHHYHERRRQQQLEQDEFFSTNRHESSSCELIIHSTSAVGINSGILLIQNTPSIRYLIESWYEHQYNTGFCRGAGDQWTLQELMLEFNTKQMSTLDNKFTRDVCVSKNKGPFQNSSRGPCSASRLYKERRHSRFSSKSSLVQMGKSNMCFMECTSTIPLQCHDCERDADARAIAIGNKPTDIKHVCLKKPPLFHHSRGMMEHNEANA